VPSSPAYAERLRIPLSWWLITAAGLFVLWLVVGAATGGVPALVFTLAVTVPVVAVLVRYGAAPVVVDDETFTAGRARIAREHLGAAEALTGEEARLARGRDCDPRAYLVLRPYLSGAVRVALTDPADPAPYWLVATRRPERLAEALGAAPRS
jgi:Protein of unknown function (DUF3093)